ncbi:MAG: hypothetical protein GX913_01525 [Clostridiales bacterium]|nr:hypothetical protein [Clostridiales bacterium]
MFEKRFTFGTKYNNKDSIEVDARELYSPDTEYGFVTEYNRNYYETLQIPEINSAFEPWYWLAGENLTTISNEDWGCSISEDLALPLTFKTDVAKQGNYHVTVTIDGGNYGIKNLMIFTGRRRLMDLGINLNPGEVFEASYTINISDIIPRSKTIPFSDTSFDLTIIADRPTLSAVSISQVEVPTIYIAGDSTVTDQSGAYPYDPGCCYAGWAQAFPAYLKGGIALSNHSHSGLTSETFRTEGHYAIIENIIKPGDFFFMQFAHNDQKLPHLDAKGGYANNLRRYIEEVRGKGAIPVIVTPLARNTWKGNDGTYNDLLLDYANACKEVGNELNVPVIDLHKRSKDFILSEGLESSKRYFYPKDYTHSNDYGAYLMAGFVAKCCSEVDLPGIKDFIKRREELFLPPVKISLPEPPINFDRSNVTEAFSVNFMDIENCPEKSIINELTKAGIISNTEETFRPNDIITRVEALSLIVKAVKYVPMNVYNDRYLDVIGHEWYAGTVEVSYQNNLVDSRYILDGNFLPNEPVTWELLISFIKNGYQSRISTKNQDLEFLPKGEDLKTFVTRGKATIAIKKLLDAI